MIDILTAIGRSNYELVKDMIANDFSVVYEISSYEHSALSLAVECNSVEIAKLLLDNGVDVNKKVTIKSPVSSRVASGFVPLMFARS